ncbi:MAG: hypothetical protein H6735_23780 [Alphaproteobacteria bacterium]|nr:hypothetical protein [Alphaproteobacteria bacterium]
MSLADFLQRLGLALDSVSVPYMLAGSVASSFHGEPRSTQDIDLVIDTDIAGVRRLVARLPPDDYYIDESAAVDAVRRRSQFNVIDLATGWKADLIIRKSRPFSVAEFGRRQHVEFLGLPFWMASPEDVVISKLEWSMHTGSERQLRDVQGILTAKPEGLDLDYIRRWVGELALVDLWRKVDPSL